MNETNAVATYDQTKPSAPIRVHIIDIDMPFGSMVTFILKWTIASIPALLILMVLGFMISAMFAGLFAGLIGRG
jgi:hypothetical protein